MLVSETVDRFLSSFSIPLPICVEEMMDDFSLDGALFYTLSYHLQKIM